MWAASAAHRCPWLQVNLISLCTGGVFSRTLLCDLCCEKRPLVQHICGGEKPGKGASARPKPSGTGRQTEPLITPSLSSSKIISLASSRAQLQKLPLPHYPHAAARKRGKNLIKSLAAFTATALVSRTSQKTSLMRIQGILARGSRRPSLALRSRLPEQRRCKQKLGGGWCPRCGAVRGGSRSWGAGGRQVPPGDNLPSLSTSALKAADPSPAGREAPRGLQHPDFPGKTMWSSLAYTRKALLA